MPNRLKLIAAALGLVVAAGTIGDASARVLDRTVVKKTVVTRSIAAPRLHRMVVVPGRAVLHRAVFHRPVFHRPVLHRFVAYRGPVLVRTNVRRIVRAPIVLKRHAVLDRTIVRKTIIR